MALALAAEGRPVVFAEPWVADTQASEPGAEDRTQFVGMRRLAPNLELLRVPQWLLQEYVAENVFDYLVMTWPHQSKYILPESRSRVVYEMVDDHALVPRMTSTWHRAHRKWVGRADVLTAITSHLVEQLRVERPDAILLPNGVRIEDLAPTASISVPDDLAEARKAPVVIIYYGSIGDPWFDWDLWKTAAAKKPDWSFVLIGYPYGCAEADIVRHASENENVFFLGRKPYAELPTYLACADVATIPFLLNDVTHACSPLKMFEYMAAGKPIVATPMRATLDFKSVLSGDGAQAFVECLEQAVEKRADPEYLATLKSEAEANTWQSRARALLDAVEAAGKRA